MQIKKIKLENIRSYESLELNFPSGSTLLAGDIGSGKTTILLAIEFALFGLQPGQKGSSLLRQGKNQGLVELELDIEGKQIIIERRLKRSKTINQEYAAISIDNIKQEKSISEIKNMVLSLLNYPGEFAKKTNLLYKFTVYTPQEEMKQIILENPETRLNTLRHVFGVDKYKKIKENTSLFTINLREEIRNKQGQVQDTEEKKTNLLQKQQLLIELKNSAKKAELELKQKQDSRKKIEIELEALEEKIQEKKTLENEIEKTKILFSSKREMILAYQKEVEKLQQQVQDISALPFKQEELEKFQKEKEQLDQQKEERTRKILEISAQISSLNSKIQENEKLREQILKIKLCPTCLQNVDNEYKENIIAKFDKQNQENLEQISSYSTQKQDILSKLNEIKEKIMQQEKKISDFNLLKIKIDTLDEKKQRVQEIEKNQQNLQKDIEILDKHIDSLKESILELSNYAAIYTKKEKEFKESSSQERQADLNLAELKKEIELNENLIEEIKQEIAKKEKIKSYLNYIIEIEQWLSDKFLNIIALTERNVLLKLREQFSKLFNEWFNILVPEIFHVRLDEDFTPIVEQQDYELDYSFLSGGERTAIALAYRLALNQTINSLLSKIKTRDLVILDEPTDGFSESQLDKMRDVLDQLNINQLILVSHEPKIESFVENVIRFKKENGLSRIEA